MYQKLFRIPGDAYSATKDKITNDVNEFIYVTGGKILSINYDRVNGDCIIAAEGTDKNNQKHNNSVTL